MSWDYGAMPEDELLAKRLARIDATVTSIERELVEIFDALEEVNRRLGFPPLSLVTDDDE